MKANFAGAFLIVGVLAGGQVIAGNPAEAGRGQESEHRGQSEQAHGSKQGVGGQEKADKRRDADKRQDGYQKTAPQSAGASSDLPRHFADQHRAAVRDYYGEEFRHGRCPPGLAKKENGCMPPGLVKNWVVGQQLPREVIFHNLPAQLVTQFGQPPAGYRYVRAADDILLIRSRTGLVVDAIPGLGMQ
jgi:Ni/Co efflux regulator RcnB